MNYTKEQIANALDLAVLKPTATTNDVKDACALASKHHIRSVCVAPIYVPLAVNRYSNICSVIGFPRGNSTPDIKYEEALDALRNGARELDVVLNYGRFFDGDCKPMLEELEAIISIARGRCAVVKAILETCYYTPKQIVEVCRICTNQGVNYVKTSTGFGPDGATPKDVRIMLDAVAGLAGVKASGGIKSYADACRYLDMGCTRLGASNFFKLLPRTNDDEQTQE